MKKSWRLLLVVEEDQKKVFLMRKILLSLQQANAQYPEVFFLEEKNIHFKNEWIFVLLKCLLFAYT